MVVNQIFVSLYIFTRVFYVSFFFNPLSHPSAGSSGDIRAGGSGRQWHLWTSLQGWWWWCCEPSFACACEQLEKMGREECGGAQIVYYFLLLRKPRLHLDRFLFLHKAPPPSLGTGAAWPGLSLPDNDLASCCSTDTRTPHPPLLILSLPQGCRRHHPICTYFGPRGPSFPSSSSFSPCRPHPKLNVLCTEKKKKIRPKRHPCLTATAQHACAIGWAAFHCAFVHTVLPNRLFFGFRPPSSVSPRSANCISKDGPVQHAYAPGE